MNIGPDGVLHVAKLAEIGVDDHELPKLVEQFNRIVDYVAQLDDVPSTAKVQPFLAGPAATPGTGPSRPGGRPVSSASIEADSRGARVASGSAGAYGPV